MDDPSFDHLHAEYDDYSDVENRTLLELLESVNFTSRAFKAFSANGTAANYSSIENSAVAVFYQNKQSAYKMTAFSVTLCSVLGCLSILLNLFVIFALIRNRRRVLKNVFYVIVLHCAVLDVIRGGCLIVYGFPTLLSNHLTFNDRVFFLKVGQITLIVLRACNLLTIFNLLVFTTNEFIVIRYPLHYRRYFRRRTVLLILLGCWIISIVFGLGSSISAPPQRMSFEKVNETLVMTTADESGESDEGRIAGIEISTLSMLMIFVLCYLCLIIVLICYTAILRTIRKFHNVDDKGQFNSDDSHRIMRNTHKEAGGSNQAVHANGNGENKRVDSRRRWRSHMMSRHKYLIVIGSVLFVDVLFLFPYSGIQLVAFLHLNNYVNASHNMTLIRWGLQIIIGIHSVCQPLCYFRMNEFRRLACCHPRSPWNRSKSFSQLHKSFANTKSNQPNEEDIDKESARGSPLPNEPLLSDSKSRKISSEWKRTESVRFRTYGEHVERRKLSDPCTGVASSVYEMESLKAELNMDALTPDSLSTN